jgi:hypothetical protein
MEGMTMFKNWKTSVSGLGTIFGSLALVAQSYASTGSLVGSVAQNLPAIVGGIGLLYAKDWNVTGAPSASVK